MSFMSGTNPHTLPVTVPQSIVIDGVAGGFFKPSMEGIDRIAYDCWFNHHGSRQDQIEAIRWTENRVRSVLMPAKCPACEVEVTGGDLCSSCIETVTADLEQFEGERE